MMPLIQELGPLLLEASAYYVILVRGRPLRRGHHPPIVLHATRVHGHLFLNRLLLMSVFLAMLAHGPLPWHRHRFGFASIVLEEPTPLR